MTHSFHIEDPSPEELEVVERARRHFTALGHVWDEPLFLHYSGDGRVWAGWRSVMSVCNACDRTIDYSEHDANVPPEPEMYDAVNPQWVTSPGGGRSHTREGCYKLGEACPGKPTFCNHNGNCPWGIDD